VADPDRAVERLDVVLVERVADQPHLDVAVLLEAVVGDDACRLLAAVLERVQGVVQRSRGVAVSQRDADDAALFGHLVRGTVCHRPI
jgi:DNA-binding phage protein